MRPAQGICDDCRFFGRRTENPHRRPPRVLIGEIGWNRDAMSKVAGQPRSDLGRDRRDVGVVAKRGGQDDLALVSALGESE